MPDITPIRTSALANPTVETIRKCVNAASASGLTVSAVAALGVHCTSTHAPRWEVEPRAEVISPLGAVLLAEQPQIADVDAVLAHVLDANRIWVMGFGDGCGGEKPDIVADGGPAARLYGQGFAVGVEFRGALHKRQGVPVERAVDETTNPVQIDTPRSVITEIVSSLTVSQVLEALADSIPGRGWEADESADCAIELRALAEDYRSVER